MDRAAHRRNDALRVTLLWGLSVPSLLGAATVIGWRLDGLTSDHPLTALTWSRATPYTFAAGMEGPVFLTAACLLALSRRSGRLSWQRLLPLAVGAIASAVFFTLPW